MCGICGFVSFNNNHPALQYTLLMNDTIRHRGPDDEGYLVANEETVLTAGGTDTTASVWQANLPYAPIAPLQGLREDFQICLGHRRLSIIDPTIAGHQPMCDTSGNVWLTFNGEIYNYLELKEELQKKGYQFQSDTDTEVLLVAYLHWGQDCVQHFNGMWSFVIYDRNKNLLFASRDRTGVKPFYYCHTGSWFAFASEQKALVKLPLLQKKVNPAAVFDLFVLNRHEVEEEGLFKDILELKPAHNLEINLKTEQKRVWQYFHLELELGRKRFHSDLYTTYTDELKEQLYHAVNIRLRADVPVGTCLSGGLDSSSLVCIINDLRKKKEPEFQQKVFTTGIKDGKEEGFDESHWAVKVAKEVNALHYLTFPTYNGLQQDLETLIYSQDIPIRSTSTYAQYRVMQLIKEHGVKVVLDGQGADELLGGYPHHKIGLGAEHLLRLRLPDFLQQIDIFGSNKQNIQFFLKNLVKFQWLPRKTSARQMRFIQQYFDELKYLNPELIEAHKDRLKQFAEEKLHPLNQRLYYEYFEGPLKELLKCEDRCSMHFSIESRTPFADDPQLMQWAFQVPQVYKIVNGQSKALLREGMKGILPEEVRQRKDKMGFVTPNNRWVTKMKDDVRGYVETLDSDFINKDLLLKDYDNFFNIENKPENYRIFRFLSFAVWRKVFEV